MVHRLPSPAASALPAQVVGFLVKRVTRIWVQNPGAASAPKTSAPITSADGDPTGKGGPAAIVWSGVTQVPAKPRALLSHLVSGRSVGTLVPPASFHACA